MVEGSEKLKEDFLLIEYREAANAYFQGVNIGYTGIKSYVTINTLFVAALGLMAEPKGRHAGVIASLVYAIPILALVVSFAFAAVIPHYNKHLENCRDRCQKIEEKRGGELFTELGRIGKARAFKSRLGFNSTFGACAIWMSIAAFWAVLGIKLWFFDSVI
jgi:hypothetical protein